MGGNVPIYNLVVLVQVAKAPMWYIAVILVGAVLGMIPLLGIVFMILSAVFSFILNIKLAKQFGKGAGFGVGVSLLPIIFLPILGFGKAQYVGVSTSANPPSGGQNGSAPLEPALNSTGAEPSMPQTPQVPMEQTPPQVPPSAPVQ